MANQRAAVTEAEIRRCLKAARDAGYEQARVEYVKADGTRVSLVAGKDAETVENGDEIDAMIERNT